MKTKAKLVFSTILFSILAWSNVFAGQSTGGYISHIATINGFILFRITGGVDLGRPSCASTDRFSVSANSEHYQAIITAFEMGSQVNLGTVMGYGTCTHGYGTEDLNWIEVNSNPAGQAAKNTFAVCVNGTWDSIGTPVRGLCSSSCTMVGNSPCTIASSPTSGSCSATPIVGGVLNQVT